MTKTEKNAHWFTLTGVPKYMIVGKLAYKVGTKQKSVMQKWERTFSNQNSLIEQKNSGT